MTLPDISTIASIMYLAECCSRGISKLRKKKTKTKSRKSRKRKQNEVEELINDLLTNPTLAIKKMGAEYVVKNRKKIIRGLINSVVRET